MRKKKKLKPVDSATYQRFRRERRCFEPEHAEHLEAHAKETSEGRARIARLEEEISRLKASMIDKALAEEEAKTAFHKGLHEGQEGLDEALRKVDETARKEGRCYDKMHVFVRGKKIVNLNMGEILSLFAQLAKSPISGGILARITVLAPEGVALPKMTERQSIDFAASVFSKASVEIEKKEVKPEPPKSEIPKPEEPKPPEKGGP